MGKKELIPTYDILLPFIYLPYPLELYVDLFNHVE